MRKLFFAVPVTLALLLAACGGGGEAVDKQAPAAPAPTVAPAPGVPGPRVLPGPRGASAAIDEAGSRASLALSGALQVAERKVVTTGSIALEVEDVESAITDVRAIAEGLGGFVEQLSSSGEGDRQRASMTIRVPQDQFFSALERIEPFGKVLSRNLGSEDVSEQFIDLEARLKSALRQEESFLTLLQRAESVSDVLTVERELSRVRSEIERLQGRLNLLERRTALATLTVSLSPPAPVATTPPSGNLTVAVSDVSGAVEEVKALVASLGGAIDRSFLSIRDDEERANINLRVFTVDFEQAIASLERQGKVRCKEIQEGSTALGEEQVRAEKPDAGVTLAQVERGRPFPVLAVVLAIVLPLLALSLAGIGLARVGGSIRRRRASSQ